MSYYLRQIGREHVVLERARIVERWRSERWDSLTFQFPNWALSLPGRSYGGDPNAFAHRDEVVRFLEDYAAFVEAPVRCGIEVTSLRRKSGSANYLIETTNGVLEARAVVIATGPFQRPRIPDLAARLPADVIQIHSSRYRNPEQLQPGSVLVVGAGASGCQIAEELHQAGRAVYFSISRHRRVPRKFRGKYVLAWLLALGYVDQSLEMFSGARIPSPMVFTGVGGGHDIDLRQFAADGVRLLGTFLDVAGSRLTFSDDVESILQAADATDLAFRAEVDEYVCRSGLSLPKDVVTAAQKLKRGPLQLGDLPSISMRMESLRSSGAPVTTRTSDG
jgi:putative flavoprotein involved in K+ transport